MRNIAVKADNVGDTLSAGDFNANFGSELEGVVTFADLSLDPAGGPDTNLTMLSQAIALYANAGAYYQDSGVADAYVLSLTTNLKGVAAYKDGMTVLTKIGNTNTGASTVNILTLGVKSITDSGGVALAAGVLVVGDYAIFRYNLSDDRFEVVIAGLTAAAQAQQEAAAAKNVVVVPANQQFHPSAAKAWVNFNGVGVVAIRDDYNVSSVIDNGVGDYTINFTNAMNNANYSASVVSDANTGGGSAAGQTRDNLTPRTTGSIRIGANNHTTGAVDSGVMAVAIFSN